MPITNSRAAALRGNADLREQVALSTERLRSHPLAMDPTLVRQLCAESLRPGAFQQHSAVVVPFVRPDPAALVEQAALEYMALANAGRPAGTIARLAQERGVDFHQLLRRIGQMYRHA